MQPLIEPRDYSDPGTLQKELATIFANCWIFAGFKTDIPNENDWFTTRVGLDSLIVQNCGEATRAFRNVCSHRFSRICDQEKGSGVLRCPYHGWQYDQEGIPCAIPKKPRFPELNAERIRELALDQYQTGNCGDLVFVRKNPEGPTLEEYLGEMYATLEAISLCLDKTVEKSSQQVRANWKINVENTLEAYHVGFVHSATFAKVGLQERGFKFVGIHSSVSSQYGEMTSSSWNAVKSKLVSVFPEDGYHHWLIFPNLLIAGSYGLSFNFGVFMPNGPDVSTFNSRLFQARLKTESRMTSSLLDSMMESVKTFNAQVFAEDVSICELVQKGVNEAQKKGILSDEEIRVCAFQEAYNGFLCVGKGEKTTEATKI
jgi:phenylpropionate dioxygenase-like ring-hydroxylating dioxygenase large terminal subunit